MMADGANRAVAESFERRVLSNHHTRGLAKLRQLRQEAIYETKSTGCVDRGGDGGKRPGFGSACRDAARGPLVRPAAGTLPAEICSPGLLRELAAIGEPAALGEAVPFVAGRHRARAGEQSRYRTGAFCTRARGVRHAAYPRRGHAARPFLFDPRAAAGDWRARPPAPQPNHLPVPPD